MEARLIFDPVCGKLCDSEGAFLKYVNCPRLKSWGDLAPTGHLGTGARFCNACDKSVIDTENMSPEDVVSVVRDDPDACLRIRIGQDNIEIKVGHE
jgi:hypothetical protein